MSSPPTPRALLNGLVDRLVRHLEGAQAHADQLREQARLLDARAGEIDKMVTRTRHEMVQYELELGREEALAPTEGGEA